ncbi:unnamed protein product [Sympodiomycopsis kandeliae]
MSAHSDQQQQEGQSQDADRTSGQEEGRTQVYERKDDAYFGYYALLSHQAQMLQDAVRTSAYQRAILGHAASHFNGKTVIDVGAGNGILSLFALQAGASKVFAIEASNMVEYLENLVRTSKGEPPMMTGIGDEENEDDAWYLEAEGVDLRKSSQDPSRPTPNPWIGDKLVPVHSKVEDVTPVKLDGCEKVDTIVSECLGVLLVHERMCESFIDARDRFLKPGGAMLPSAGTICFAPIQDKAIWDESAAKARFWQNNAFYGVDVTPFFPAAWKETFSSPVIGCFNPHTIMASSADHFIDFQTIPMEDLKTFKIPIDWCIKSTGIMHGIGGWFDLHFQPPSANGSADKDSVMTEQTNATSSSDPSSVAYGGMSGSAPPFQPTFDPNALTSEDSDPNNAASTLLAAAAAAAASSGELTGIASLDSSAGNTSYMTTSPFSTPTHWQQARLLLPEPLAVNRGQTIKGEMTFKVNENRSYDIRADIWIDAENRSTRRRFQWKLDRQTYSWTTSTVGQSSS